MDAARGEWTEWNECSHIPRTSVCGRASLEAGQRETCTGKAHRVMFKFEKRKMKSVSVCSAPEAEHHDLGSF